MTDDYLLKSNLSDDSKEILEELEEKSKSLCTELQDRLISLSACVKALKTEVCKEKILWRDELKETINLENKLSESNRKQSRNQRAGDCLNEHIEKEVALNLYRQKILEAENMCNMEMLKIKSSIETLVPLQIIMNEWNVKTKE